MNELYEQIVELIEEEPDAVVLYTADADGELSGSVSMAAEYDGEDAELFKRAVIELMASQIADAHPNEMGYGVTKATGGGFSPVGDGWSGSAVKQWTNRGDDE